MWNKNTGIWKGHAKNKFSFKCTVNNVFFSLSKFSDVFLLYKNCNQQTPCTSTLPITQSCFEVYFLKYLNDEHLFRVLRNTKSSKLNFFQSRYFPPTQEIIRFDHPTYKISYLHTPTNKEIKIYDWQIKSSVWHDQSPQVFQWMSQ